MTQTLLPESGVDHFSSHLHHKSETPTPQKYIAIVPLTAPFCDRLGHTIQLCSAEKFGLVGLILKGETIEQIVPGSSIRNPLNPDEPSTSLAKRLGNCPNNVWDLAFDVQSTIITIWPHLRASGKGEEHFSRPRQIFVKGSPIRYLSERDLIQKMESRGFVRSGDRNEWMNSDKHTTIHLDRHGEGHNPDEPTHIDVRYRGERYKEATVLKKQQLATLEEKQTALPKRVERGEISQKNANLEYDRLKQEITSFREKMKPELKWRFVYGEKPPPGSGGGKPPPKGGDPASKDFEQRLQQTKLTKDFNANHRQNPVPAKGGTGGTIGGVGCSVEYIEGLFDTPESLFEEDHYFCVPSTEEGVVPFSEGQLRQILRELAIGIYTHGTVPFFSLHFRQGSSDLFPVIHPAYQNTLVGRVIGMLDYFMKGYLNGGVFSEAFIDEWHRHAGKQNPKTSLEKMIIFSEYCQQHLQGEDKRYLSTRDLEEICKKLTPDLSLNLGQETSVLANCEGFANSFRIIAKQNSFQKHNNLFVIDSDFDVFYTISPSPEYEENREGYVRKMGQQPPSYQFLTTIFEETRQKIHDHMVKMPLCKEYFSMLGVINFFSSYFSTLKKHRKVPVLFPIKQVDTRGCPPLFPHLPITVHAKESLHVNIQAAAEQFWATHRALLTKYLLQEIKYNALYETPDQRAISEKLRLRESLQGILANALQENVLNSCSPIFRRTLIPMLRGKAGDHLREATLTISKKFFVPLCAAIIENAKKYKGQTIEFEKLVNIIVPDFISKAPSNRPLELSSFSYRQVGLASELSEKEVHRNQEIVGGCGMQLDKKRVAPSEKTARIVQENWHALQSLKTESWQQVSSGNEKGMAFRLLFEDVPPWLTDNYTWMESMLFSDTGPEEIEHKEKIVEAIDADNYQEFVRLTNIIQHKDKPSVTLMHLAAKRDNPAFVQHVLEKGGSLYAQDENGYLPIHYAAMSGSVQTLAFFISKDKSLVNTKSHHGSSPVITAIQFSKIGAVQILCKEKPEPSLLSGGYTDLHAALHEGHEEIIRSIMACDSLVAKTINVCSQVGGTPLMMACELESEDFVCALLDKGANATVKRKDGVTAFEIAVRRKNIALMNRLLRKSIPSSIAFEALLQEGTVEMVDLVLNHYKNLLLYKNAAKDTPIHIALNHGNIAIALKMSTFKELHDVQNVEGYTPISLAAALGSWEVVEELYKSGAKPQFEKLLRAGYHSIVKKIFQEANLPQHQLQLYFLYALQVGNYLTATLVLQPLGAKAENLIGPHGWQAIHYAAKSDAIFLFRLEINRLKELLVPLREEENKTTAYIAAENGSSRVFSFLLEKMKQEQVSLHKHFHDRHLVYGVLEGEETKIIEKTFSLFPEVISTPIDADNTFPLHLAASLGLENTVRLLVEKGADVHVQDCHQRSALYYALRARNAPSVHVLLEKHVPIHPHDLIVATSNDEMFSILTKSQPSQKVLGAALYEAIDAHDSQAFFKLHAFGASCMHLSPEGWTPILKASYLGLYEALEVLVREDQPDLRKKDGNTALHFACKEGHIRCAEILISTGFPINLKNEQQKTLLEQTDEIFQVAEDFSHVVPFADLEKIEASLKLLPKDERIVIEHEGRKIWGTPLQIFLRLYPKKDSSTWLLRFGPYFPTDPNIQDSYGETLAHLLIRAHADPFSVDGIRFDIVNHKRQSPVHIASKQSTPALFRQILERLPPNCVHEKDYLGKTPIFYAIESGNTDKTRLLFEKGADLNQKDYHHVTPLLYACEKGEPPLVITLLECGANPNKLSTLKRITPLHHVIMKGEKNLFRCLLAHGANPSIPTGEGTYPIHFATLREDSNIMLRLLSIKGASLYVEDNSFLPMHKASLLGKTATLEELRNLQAEYLEPFSEISISSDALQMKGATPLHLAALAGHTETVDWLLKQYADVEAQDAQKQTILDYAAEGESAALLFERFSTHRIMEDPKNLFSAIIKTIRGDNVAAMTSLYDRRVSVHASLIEKTTGLHMASSYGALECTAWLLQHGADPFATNEKNQNAFALSIKSPSAEQFKLLIEHTQIPPDDIHSETQPLVHIAVRENQLRHLLILFMQGSSIDVPDSSGRTPLYMSVQEGHEEITSFLLSCGADQRLRDCDGRSPLDTPLKKSIRGLLAEKIEEVVGDSRLHHAVRSSHPLAILMLAQREDLSHRNSEGETAYGLAVRTGKEHYARLIQLGSRRNTYVVEEEEE